MQFSVTSNELRKIGKDLKKSGQKDLQREMLKRMRTPVQKIVPDVRAAVRATPGTTGHTRSGISLAERPRSLRDSIARGVQVKSSLSGKYVGVRIRIDPRHLPRGSKKLPKYLEGTMAPWRHPTYGRRATSKDWQEQRSHPYFFPTIRQHVPQIQREVSEVVLDITRRITRGN